MNLRLSSRTDKFVDIHCYFVNSTVFQFSVQLRGKEVAMYAVIGRDPRELRFIDMIFDNKRHSYYPKWDHKFDPTGCTSEIIHLGGRSGDVWSEMLYNEALRYEAEEQHRLEDGETPKLAKHRIVVKTTNRRV